ncbi:MAG: hypothetical protein LH660_08750, partial [Phormidesmis sp. CAN_BIN36]|nr:hypothetical protein [Phormidesmis sp. CAN_BIN36]
MKRAPWIIAIAVSCAAVVGAAIATSVRFNDSSRSPAPSIAASPEVLSPSPSPSASTASIPSPQPKLDDFPHQRIVLKDQTDPEFARFRQQLQQAIQT